MKQFETMPDEQLIVRLREGESEIMDFLMIKYKEMVRKKAKEMYLIGGENDDLIQEGMIGLIKAVRDFDVSLGTSFISFAQLCVSRQMYSAIQASKRQKHFPLNSYVSLYDSREGQEDDSDLPLIDTIEPGVENNPEALYFGKESTQALIAKLEENLSVLENKVLYLYLAGADYRTIANILDKSPKVIDNALQRIRGKAGKLVE